MTRAIGFFILWVVLAGNEPADFAAGAVAVLAATWASLGLLPPGERRVRPAAFARYALHFVGQSIVAGADVAKRALDPALPLHRGFVLYPTVLPAGPARSLFASLMSLLPGTVPTRSQRGGALLIHCLDVEQPVAAQLTAEEALFAQAIGERRGDG
jgi:multicomponent Na+:H+ antiporter subunit E